MGEKYKYKQGDRVYFSLGDEDKPSGYATVCGIQGFIVIIQPEKAIKDYPFSHLYVVDSQVVSDPDQVAPKSSGA